MADVVDPRSTLASGAGRVGLIASLALCLDRTVWPTRVLNYGRLLTLVPFVPRSWVKERVASLEPERNQVRTEEGRVVDYDYLVVASGIQINWGGIPGLSEALKDPQVNVTSNYSYDSCGKTWDLVQAFQGGRAIFTQPAVPIKCAGAPQKVCPACGG